MRHPTCLVSCLPSFLPRFLRGAAGSAVFGNGVLPLGLQRSRQHVTGLGELGVGTLLLWSTSTKKEVGVFSRFRHAHCFRTILPDLVVRSTRHAQDKDAGSCGAACRWGIFNPWATPASNRCQLCLVSAVCRLDESKAYRSVWSSHRQQIASVTLPDNEVLDDLPARSPSSASTHRYSDGPGCHAIDENYTAQGSASAIVSCA